MSVFCHVKFKTLWCFSLGGWEAICHPCDVQRSLCQSNGTYKILFDGEKIPTSDNVASK